MSNMSLLIFLSIIPLHGACVSCSVHVFIISVSPFFLLMCRHRVFCSNACAISCAFLNCDLVSVFCQ